MIFRIRNSNTGDKIELRFASNDMPSTEMKVYQVVGGNDTLLYKGEIPTFDFSDISISARNNRLSVYVRGEVVWNGEIERLSADVVEMEVEEGSYLIDEMILTPHEVSQQDIASWHVIDAPFMVEEIEDEQAEMDGSFFGLPSGRTLLILEGDSIDAEGEMVVRFHEVNQ